MTAKDNDVFVFGFRLEEYRALPPYVDVIHPTTGSKNAAACMAEGCLGYFHSNNILCAPWNRLAYSIHGGPHTDWDMLNWESIHPEHQELGTILDLLYRLLNGNSYGGRRKG
ncbi:MAG: hypothetical protein ACYC96_09760 [Fimbriimonadaceae bacterium]